MGENETIREEPKRMGSGPSFPPSGERAPSSTPTSTPACPASSLNGPAMRRSIPEAKVAFVPGGAFFTDGTGRNSIRLSYSLPTEAQIAEGIARLGKLIAASLT